MDIEAAKKSRSQAKRTFTRLRKNLQRAISENVLQKTIRNRFVELRAAWKTVQIKHDEYISCLTEDNDTEEDWITEMSNIFCTVEEETDAYIETKMKEIDEEKDAEKERRDLAELSVHREQEVAKVLKCIAHIKMLMDETTADYKESAYRALKEAKFRLEERMSACEEVHLKYVSLLRDKAEMEMEKDWVLSLWNPYNDTCNHAHIVLSQYKMKAVTPMKPDSLLGIKLEGLKFQSFDGNLRKYPKFKHDFLKHIQPLYKEEQAAFVLKSYLSIEVREEVDNLDELVDVWARLDKKYGDEGKHIDAIMAEIKDAPICEEGDTEPLIQMINTIEKALRDLLRLGLEKEINNSIIVSMIEEKMPGELQKEWLKVVTGKHRLDIARNKFPSLLKLLLEYRERMEYFSSSIRSRESWKGNVNLSQTRSNINGDSTKKQRCWIHQVNGDHPIWRCRIFEGKSPTEKIELVRKNNACFACLEIGHTATNCKRGFKCKQNDCSLPHHQLLHEARATGIVFHGCKKGSEVDTILQLQKAKCGKKHGTKIPLSILWDGGSTLSFITFEKAKQLKLSGEKVTIEIVKVGGDIKLLDSCRYDLYLEDKSGDTTGIEVLGIDAISTDIAEVKLDDIVVMFHELRQSKLDRPNNGNIDCLIGFQYAAFHPVRKQAIGHLLLLENKFGYVIGGSHPKIKEETRKLVKRVKLHFVSARIEDFYSMENLGI